MAYPNSVTANGGGGRPRLSGRPSALPRRPVPRTPVGPSPRRKPGRPPPRQTPRRAPGPNWRPAGRPLPVIQRPPLPSIGGNLGWGLIARLGPYGLAFAVGFAVTAWLLGRGSQEAGPEGAVTLPPGWGHWGVGTEAGPASWAAGGINTNATFSPTVAQGGSWVTAPNHYDIFTAFNNAGPGSASIGKWQVYTSPLGTRRQYHRASFRVLPGETPAAEPLPEYYPPGSIIAGDYFAFPGGSGAPVASPWQYGYVPLASPILPQPPMVPEAPPVKNPVKRPMPLTPEMPDVGPHPTPKPNPVPEWPVIPVPPELPGVSPGVGFVPGLVVGNVTHLSPNHLPRVNFRTNPRVRRAKRGEKETKARMGRVLGFLWSATGQMTEYLDTIDVLYEALPKQLKRNEYASRGRQPNPAERAKILYDNINQLDVEKAITSYIKEQIEDMMYAAGSDKIAQANRDNFRPIGYEAGGSLTGGGEYVGMPDTAPEWWPETLPWSP